MASETMIGAASPADSVERADQKSGHYLFRFGRARFNEASQELWVDGEHRKLAAKPRSILRALLTRPNTVVSRKELEACAWPDKPFPAPNWLPTAIYSLRAALGDDGEKIIQTVSGFGYKLAGAVEASPLDPTPHPPISLQIGDAVPYRVNWRLERRLDDGAPAHIWLGRNVATHGQMVFKFAGASEQLADLEREMVSSRSLQGKLGERDDILPVVDVNFDDYPFFIATPIGGADLVKWLGTGAGGPTQPERGARVNLMASVARTLGDAHDAGVPHSALGPQNIFVTMAPDGAPKSRLAAFGGSNGGILYQPPEGLRGGTPTLGADIYALGILLYQVIVGDLARPLSAGWEREIDDDLLCQDIALAAAGDPALRLDSAKALAMRLETLESRRVLARAEFERAQENERLTRTAELRRVEAAHAAQQARRAGWVATALGALLLMATALAVWALKERQAAVIQRDRANQIAGVAEDMVSGLIDDMAGGLTARSILTLADLRRLEERARATVGRLGRLTPDAPVLRRLEARDLDRLADTDLHQSDLAGSLTAARRAADLQEALVKDNPVDPGLRVELAQSDRWIGDIALKRRDFRGASRAYSADRDSLAQAAALAGHDPDVLVKLAGAVEAIGDVQMAQGDFAGAFINYDYALNLIKSDQGRPVQDGPAGLLALSTAQEKIGDALEGEKDWRGALAAYRSDLSIRQRLATLDPENMRLQRDVSIAWLDVGDEQAALDDLKGAASSYSQALDLCRERAAKDPSNTLWQEDVAVALSDIGDLDIKAGNRREAAIAYRRALSVVQALTKKDPTDVRFALDLIDVESDLGDDLARLGDTREAATHAAVAAYHARRLAAEHPDDPGLKDRLSQTTALAERLGAR
jgi:DNA-binding winged helix-turn-helix (wHTH) protein/tetratricopeptide (TPR) repeat protein